MFRQILVPSDGSASADKAFRAALAFARETGAAIIGLPEGTGERLQAMQEAARAAGVRFAVLPNEAADPADGLAAAIQASACDVVFVATHSVSPGLLARASVPVMAYR